MKFSEETLSIRTLVEQFNKNAMLVNAEYQRGAVWVHRQQAKFIDSIFRNYPVPAVFLRAIEHQGLRGTHSTFELIDGQQRLRALSEFIADTFRLPTTSGPDRLRLPPGVATQSAPWAGHSFSELDAELQDQILGTLLHVFIVEHPAADDEVRDLFIRLQSGTPLTRQQVRDAWPGPIAPFIEQVGGKGRRLPQSRLLTMVDKRGDRDTDEGARDPWVGNRQTCAQLLSVFLARERDPYARPRVSADELDELYQETTEFEASGPVARRFRGVLDVSEKVFESAAKEQIGQKTKWRKIHVFAVFAVVHDVLRNASVPLNENNLHLLGQATSQMEEQLRLSRSRFSSASIAQWGEFLREGFFRAAGRLDAQRFFSLEQKQELRRLAKDLCGICGSLVSDADAEYDHFPIPWAMCGATRIENGRLVHKSCHPRGRPTSAK